MPNYHTLGFSWTKTKTLEVDWFPFFFLKNKNALIRERQVGIKPIYLCSFHRSYFKCHNKITDLYAAIIDIFEKYSLSIDFQFETSMHYICV